MASLYKMHCKVSFTFSFSLQIFCFPPSPRISQLKHSSRIFRISKYGLSRTGSCLQFTGYSNIQNMQMKHFPCLILSPNGWFGVFFLLKLLKILETKSSFGISEDPAVYRFTESQSKRKSNILCPNVLWGRYCLQYCTQDNWESQRIFLKSQYMLRWLWKKHYFYQKLQAVECA